MSSLLFSFTLFEIHHHYRRSKLSSHTKLLDANQRIKLQAHEIEKNIVCWMTNECHWNGRTG